MTGKGTVRVIVFAAAGRLSQPNPVGGAARIAECVVELEGAGGRMRIQLKGIAAAELVGPTATTRTVYPRTSLIDRCDARLLQHLMGLFRARLGRRQQKFAQTLQGDASAVNTSRQRLQRSFSSS
jgi:hypothetical protein